MCLHKIKSPAKRKEWLGKKSDTFTVYKAVQKLDGKYYPPSFGTTIPLNVGINELEKAPEFTQSIIFTKKPFCYRPYYHLFLTKEGATWWRKLSLDRVIVKCKVNKKDVKSIGTQYGFLVIVAKKFEIVEEVRQCV